VAAGIVNNNSMVDARLSEFPSRKTTLVAGAGFVHPNMYLYPFLVRLINRRTDGTPFNTSQPTSVAIKNLYNNVIGIVNGFDCRWANYLLVFDKVITQNTEGCSNYKRLIINI
jgi:hypothetical protein